jgi:predicted secreted protein
MMQPDLTEHIKLKIGDSTTVKLKGLATAGYEWNYTVDGNKDLITISKEFILPEKLTRKNIGTSADEVFTITAHSKGQLTIYFFQKRGWEKNSEPINKKKVNITIE